LYLKKLKNSTLTFSSYKHNAELTKHPKTTHLKLPRNTELMKMKKESIKAIQNFKVKRKDLVKKMFDNQKKATILVAKVLQNIKVQWLWIETI